MSSSKRKEKDNSQPPTPPRWKGSDFLELVHHFNARALTLLKECGTQYRDVWGALDADAIRRAARLPFLIVGVHFTDEPWWRSVVMNPQGAPGEPLGLWPAEVAKQFMSEVLVFAWHAAKRDAQVARLTLGMVQEVVEIIRGLTPQQLDSVSGLQGGALQLRWQEDLDFWTRLLNAARDGDEVALADVHLHAKLRLSGELIERSTGKVGPEGS